VWESEEKFYHWLRIIALNHTRRYQRAEQRISHIADHGETTALDDELERFMGVWKAQETAIEDTVILLEMYTALDKALRTLKPREQEILMLWLNGQKPHEIARVYDMKTPTISMLLLRAKERIRVNISHTSLFNKEE
jgi:RNA polymerase sigma factor (sigma-70 family)